MESSLQKRTIFNGTKSFYINICIMLAIMIFVRFVPTFGSMTASGMAVLGVFLGTIYGWMALKDMPLASAVGIIMMGTTGIYDTPVASVQAAFSHNLFISAVGCFALVAVMQHSGLIEYLVRAILNTRLARTSIPALLILLNIFSYFFGFFGSFGLYALIWTLWKGIVDEINEDKKLFEFGLAITSIGFVLCACAWQFVPPTMVVEGLFTSVSGLSPASTPKFLIWMFIAFALMNVLFMLAGKFIFKVQFPKNVALKDGDKTSMNSYQITTLVLFIVYLLILIVSNCTTAIPFISFLGKFNIVGLGITCLIICLIIRPKGCYDLINVAMNGSIQWGMLFTMGVVGLFTVTLGSEDVGISQTIASACDGLTSLPPVLFVLVLIIVPLILTQFFNNMALCTIFIPVGITLAQKMGLNEYAIFYTMFITCNTALATPSGSANSAFWFSWPGIDRKNCFKYGWTICVITAIVGIFMYFVLGNLFF